MDWQAKWIWKKQDSYGLYNQTVEARRIFRCHAPRRARLRVTADSFYRLFINGEWVQDGPCRSWPEHYQYDEIDATGWLRPGDNEICIVGRYYGTGDFHRVPRHAGILAQLDIEEARGATTVVATDETWDVAVCHPWICNTPKVAIQMEPWECYDARLEGHGRHTPAAVLYDADQGPWGDLHPRDVALLDRQPAGFRSFVGAALVERSTASNFCLAAHRLLYPELVSANHHVAAPCGMATVVEMKKPGVLRIDGDNMMATVDGRRGAERGGTATFRLAAGRHIVVTFVHDLFSHNWAPALRLDGPWRSMRLVNPLDAAERNPWAWIVFDDLRAVGDDLEWPALESDEWRQWRAEYETRRDALLSGVKTESDFAKKLASLSRSLPLARMFDVDTHWRFQQRRPIAGAAPRVEHPEALMADNAAETIVYPDARGEVELAYDLGRQVCGYYELDLEAQSGVQVDVFGIEYITPNGTLQHSGDNRNGVRYVTRSGRNRFVSLKRRSGRYLFITLRNQTDPVRIRLVRVIESTYPANRIGSFSASDARLGAIWEASARTLQLCMEDTYTDCPLYEQTLWVGDARNESLFGYWTFDARDIGRRCIELAAQSLERYPIVGCQVPSSWDVLLPAWSFLWGISVWDYYEYTGDAAALRHFWRPVLRNLRGAEKHLDENGLFSGRYWNLFDWSGSDQNQRAVLHNSMLMVGAIDAALQCGGVLGDKKNIAWLRALRGRLVKSLRGLWDSRRKAWPDSIHDDGTRSPTVSQHTSFLALLYDIVTPATRSAALKNVLDPPKGMVRVGSPFAMMYYYEALEKVGESDAILRSIYDSYLPMLEVGATTVWETFPQGGIANLAPGEFPTRSHCHAWSAAPLYFLPRVVLGVRPTRPGGAAYDVSPRLSGLEWAKGTVATARGALTVSWRRDGDVLRWRADAPAGTRVRFVKNDSMRGLRIVREK